MLAIYTRNTGSTNTTNIIGKITCIGCRGYIIEPIVPTIVPAPAIVEVASPTPAIVPTPTTIEATIRVVPSPRVIPAPVRTVPSPRVIPPIPSVPSIPTPRVVPPVPAPASSYINSSSINIGSIGVIPIVVYIIIAVVRKSRCWIVKTANA